MEHHPNQVGGNEEDHLDHDFVALFGSRDYQYRISDIFAGVVELRLADGLRQYRLKPLEELYGPGHGFPGVDPLNQQYQPLLYAIESTILEHYDENPDLNDPVVALTLDRMATHPSCNPAGDMLCQRVQTALRCELSLNNYSQQEVKQALRVVLRSVNRHSRIGGVTGYLEFMDRMMIA